MKNNSYPDISGSGFAILMSIQQLCSGGIADHDGGLYMWFYISFQGGGGNNLISVFIFSLLCMCPLFLSVLVGPLIFVLQLGFKSGRKIINLAFYAERNLLKS